MSEEFLGDRRRALEEGFFAKKDQELLQRMKQQMEMQQFAELLGIPDLEVLDKLRSLGIGPETAAAISLVPMVEVAWADGNLKPAERRAVLEAAEQCGILRDSPAYALLNNWLEHRPASTLRHAWTDYVKSLVETMEPAARQALKQEVLGRARNVAEAAGGILGLGNRVSDDERQMLELLERAFEEQG